MKSFALVSAALISSLGMLSAQPSPTPAPQNAYLASLVKSREQRAALLLAELKASDQRIEERIATIVDGLTRIQDSRDSGSQVARLKAETMAALVKNIETFQRKRAALVAEMTRPTLRITIAQKKKIIDIFDARIEKRVAQILALQKSFPIYQESDRYQAVGGGDNGPYFVQNEAWRQNRRMSQQTDSQREKVIAGLKKSISRLESQKNLLKGKAAASKIPLQVQMINDEIVRIDGLIAERRAQVAEIYEGTSGGGRKVSQREAGDLNKTLDEAQAALQRDINTLFLRYSQFLTAVSDLDAARTAAASGRY
ncbi:MAG: hypothetical protein ACREKL_10120 [Chthoniobacterales bacterium]